tara:strand:- start:929 stop:1162 length:234 start_codon:yes stop_codon:yes gene_type:complete
MNTETLKVRGVSIGDRFINTTHRKSKRISTVTQITEEKCLITGEVLKHHFYAEHEFMGQTLRTEVIATTVLRNKVDE